MKMPNFTIKLRDTMDVWLDSGISHFSVLKQNKDLAFLRMFILKVLINIEVGLILH